MRRLLAVLACGWGLCGCADLTFALVNAPTVFGSYHRVKDIPYGPEQQQRLDIYVPRKRTSSAVVVFWYGGSWQTGERSQYRFVGAALAERGVLTVIPDYKLYPAVKFPELMNDGEKAVAWVHEHARELGADPNHIILMGHSAGAHMAALLATKYLGACKCVVGLVGLSGPYALDPNTDVLRTIFGPPSTPADWQPVRFASKASPPALLLHGADDTVVSPNQTREFETALRDHGVKVETHFYPKRGHADTVASFALPTRWRTPALEQTRAFISAVADAGTPVHTQ